MSDSTSTTPTRDRLRRWRTPIVAAAVSGGVLLGGYGIAAAADSTPAPSSPSESESAEPSAPGSPDATEPNRTRPDAPGGRGEGCDEEGRPAPDAESSSTATT
ncbi:hypothetical protein [Jiangella mangrovi]|uniref:Uncharacterized protein n=1 Tax=Jiangella mangrovi TaxID=1524084 RepID=A0A7W9GLH3_9ACTN|nr:hypothetical protein [Jiangella mangrovi]MBB5785872.1 hypothetical protein [Jiangella mangrovi]